MVFKGGGKGTRGTWPVLGQNSDSVSPPTHHPWCPPCFSSYFFSCRPSPKPSLLDGWKTSMDGSVGREEDEPWVLHCACPEGTGPPHPARAHSPGPSRYWDREKRRRRTMGSVRSTFHAVATSSCQGTDTLAQPRSSTQAGAFGDPLGACAHPLHASSAGETPGTHIEEADVHMEVDVHVIDGAILPVRTHVAVARGVAQSWNSGLVPTVPGRAGSWDRDMACVAPHVSSVCTGGVPRMWM